MTSTQTWSADTYSRNAAFVSRYGLDVLDLLDPKFGERILDLGCGDGALTQSFAEKGCVVTGVDASEDMLAAAREKGIPTRLLDARKLDFENEFDAVFSNAMLHWISPDETPLVLKGVNRALKSGGRFVAEFGGAGCVRTVRAALHRELENRDIDPTKVDPWYFPETMDYHRKLADAGFKVTEIRLFERPTVLPGDIKDWLEIFGRSFLSSLAERDRPDFLDVLKENLRSELQGADGVWTVDYVRLRFSAYKPQGEF